MTNRLFVVVAILGFASFGVGCSQPAPPAAPPATAPKTDLAAEERAIRESDARWLKAEQADDAAGAAANIAPDGAVYREHVEPIMGPAAFQAFTTKFRASNPKAKPSWSTDKIQVGEAGDIAIQTGEYHLTGLGPNGSGEDRGRFLTVWKKVNGEWKVAHDMGSTTMPEPISPKKP